MKKDFIKENHICRSGLSNLYPALGDWWALVTDCYGTSSHARGS